eukprot:scaffold1670_cov370-Prasinococcus_capsulatus_cf.AAC.8
MEAHARPVPARGVGARRGTAARAVAAERARLGAGDRGRARRAQGGGVNDTPRRTAREWGVLGGPSAEDGTVGWTEVKCIEIELNERMNAEGLLPRTARARAGGSCTRAPAICSAIYIKKSHPRQRGWASPEAARLREAEDDDASGGEWRATSPSPPHHHHQQHHHPPRSGCRRWRLRLRMGLDSAGRGAGAWRPRLRARSASPRHPPSDPTWTTRSVIV